MRKYPIAIGCKPFRGVISRIEMGWSSDLKIAVDMIRDAGFIVSKFNAIEYPYWLDTSARREEIGHALTGLCAYVHSDRKMVS